MLKGDVNWMKAGHNLFRLGLAVISVLFLVIPLSLCGCGSPFPYQGSLNGNWSGQLSVLSKSIPIGGTMSVNIDSKGAVTGTISSTSGGANPATISGQVDSNGNLTGSVTLTINTTNFISNWQGKMTASGKNLSMQGTWTSQHGSGTFTGTGTTSK
jgi:hypothetical protein